MTSADAFRSAETARSHADEAALRSAEVIRHAEEAARWARRAFRAFLVTAVAAAVAIGAAVVQLWPHLG